MTQSGWYLPIEAALLLFLAHRVAFPVLLLDIARLSSLPNEFGTLVLSTANIIEC